VNLVPLHAPRLVGDLMALEPVVVRADASLGIAAKLLERNHVSGLPVVDGAGSLVGVISQTDLLRARATEHLWANWQALRVRHLMTAPALTVHRDQQLTIAARKMERHRVHRLVVVADADERLPIGVLSTSDLVRAMSGLPGDEPDDGPQEEVVIALAGDYLASAEAVEDRGD
jgi:CBS domain-containing protein